MSDHFIAPWDLQEEPLDESYGQPPHGQQNEQLVGSEKPNAANPFAENGVPQEDDKNITVTRLIDKVVNQLNGVNVVNEEENNEHGTIPPCESGELRLVKLGDSGEGFPYAPVNWPNTGDNWSWRVGKRLTNYGLFQDRFLYPPKHFPKLTGIREPFASKTSVTTYIRTVFPDANVDAFFSSFSWKIPGNRVSPSKEPIPISSPRPVLHDKNVEGQVEGEASRLRKRKPKAPTPQPQSPPPPKQKRQRSATKSSTPKQKTKEKNVSTSSTAGKGRTRHNPKQTAAVPFTEEDAQGEEFNIEIPEDFDNYLNSLEDIIAQPLSESTIAQGKIMESRVADDDEMAEARHRLSSLLVMDFPTLVLSRNFSELAPLATKLQNDPRMTAEQLVKLKLIEEIPSFRKVFLESREIIDQVDRQFGTLEANKSKVASLKSEYSELKEKTDQLQAQIDGNLSTVEEINKEIARLEVQRAELINAVESNKAAKVEVNYAQKMVANAIPNVVHEIQNSNSKIPEWDLKRSNAVKREAEIRSKFAPLQGFSLIPPPFQGLFL